MKRHIPGLHGDSTNTPSILEGVFLVRVDRVFYRWHPERPFYVLRLIILERENSKAIPSTVVCTALQSTLETPLVPAGLWLRPRSLGPGRSGRKGAPRPSRNRADFPHRPERPLLSQSRRVCPCQ